MHLADKIASIALFFSIFSYHYFEYYLHSTYTGAVKVIKKSNSCIQ